jgi:orotidine-5'-phosphate decarboxylase
MALLESMTWVGAQIFLDIVESAKEHGLVIIADAKRNDIATSAQGYADAFLGASVELPPFARGYDVHAMTVNPFLGRDSLQPFLETCRLSGKGIFVLAKTSNRGSTETQDVLLRDPPEPAYALYARMIAEVGTPLVGSCGYSAVGAVVGATFREQAERIRRLMPKAIILVPGYGAQGATADDVAVSFNSDGLGAIVNSSRGITAKFSRPDISPERYAAEVRENALRMIDDITGAVDRRLSR